MVAQVVLQLKFPQPRKQTGQTFQVGNGGSLQNARNSDVTDASLASILDPGKSSSRHTMEEATNALPCPNCMLCHISTLWKNDLKPGSWSRRRVNGLSSCHGIVAGGMVRKKAGESLLIWSIWKGPSKQFGSSHTRESHRFQTGVTIASLVSHLRRGRPWRQPCTDGRWACPAAGSHLVWGHCGMTW